MRNLAYFLVGFLLICIVGLMSACTLPPRLLHPDELRAIEQRKQELTEWQQVERRVAEKKHESALWWSCTNHRRSDEC